MLAYCLFTYTGYILSLGLEVSRGSYLSSVGSEVIITLQITTSRRHASLHAFVRRSAPSKCVRCASLRSGGRRLAVRIAKEHPIGTLPRTPFPASRDFPSRGNEKIGGTGYCVTYDTDSQSRNADFISIALRAIRNPQRRRRCQT